MAAADMTPASEDAAASAAADTAFTQAQEAGDELEEAVVEAARKAELSATEATQRKAKASRDAWQELAKAAAEILKAEPLPDETKSEDEAPDRRRPSGTGDRKV